MRELRRRASRYLALVARGERIEVTDRGRPVAMLVPVHGQLWDGLLVNGRIVQPPDTADAAQEEPVDYGVDASDVLRSMRALKR